MKLKPLVEALGMRPDWWLTRFTIISKQVWWDEKRSHDVRQHTFKTKPKVNDGNL